MIFLRNRTRVVTAATACFVLGLSSLAGASESQTTVSTEATEPGRQLEVLDLSGSALENLRLRHGRAQAFEVRVTDTDQDPENDFHVDTTMNNLHLVDGDNHVSDNIASQNVSLSFPGNPLGASGLSVDLEPRYLVSTTGEITCDTSPLACDLLDSLAGVLGLLGLESAPEEIAFENVDLIGSLINDIDLDALGVTDLPLGLGHGDGGSYDNAECLDGTIGAQFCDGTTAATALQALRGTPNDIAGDLLDALSAALGDLEGDLVGEDGVFALDDVLATLLGSDADLLDGDGAVLGTVSDLGQALTDDYTAAEQTDLLNDMLSATLEDLELGDLLHLNGRYSSYPALTVNTDGAAGGVYEGTLVVTLIE